MPRDAQSFSFDSFVVQQPTSVSFHYSVTLESGAKEQYEELLDFSSVPDSASFLSSKKALPFLRALHLMLGVSYWKMDCAKDIRMNAGYALDKNQAMFWTTVYTKGLGEFFYKNAIDFRKLVQFPSEEMPRLNQNVASGLSLSESVLVPLGGGKDSIVTAEMLKQTHALFEFFAVNPHPLQTEVSTIAGIPLIPVRRIVDSKMVALSKNRDVFTGHVPMTAIYGFIGLLVAAIRGHKELLFSNERSASYGNTQYLGEEINHQWSKSEEFEHMMQSYVSSYITPDIRVRSNLRSYTELEVVGKFMQYPQYFHHFSSCNKNFALAGSKNPEGSLWCGVCPKCAFAFLLLAAYLPKKNVVDIFHKDLFADKSLVSLYRELLGLTDVKPFECVGTPEETAQAFAMVQTRMEFAGEPALEMYEREQQKDLKI